MSSLKPMLLTCMKTYSREQFVKDVTAGIIVAIIALPLSIALALASGVGPEAGIFTAIVAGFVISALGGSSVQIAGPTAAFATIVAGIVAKNGLDGLVICDDPGRNLSDSDGTVPFWYTDPFYSVHHHHRIYSRNCCDHRDRSAQRFLWRDLSGRSKTH